MCHPSKFSKLAGWSLLAAAMVALVGQETGFSVVTDMNDTLADVLMVADTEAPAPTAADSAPGLDELIATLTVVDELPQVPGYERDCGKGAGCVFGPSWTDNYVGPDSHNGCDTRNDVLRDQLSDVRFKLNTHDCKVVSGTLNDPYTGQSIAFSTTNPSAVQVDHLFPLSRSWRAGAALWTQAQRITFANDTAANLIASDGKANQSKSDQGPDTWLPPNAAFRCEYSQNYLAVAAKYHLTVTVGDVDATRRECTR